MNFIDILYKHKDQIGIKSDVTYGELLELIKIINDNNIVDKDNSKDIKVLIDISMEMTNLLKECRKNKLPLSLSKHIDNILEKIEEL